MSHSDGWPGKETVKWSIGAGIRTATSQELPIPTFSIPGIKSSEKSELKIFKEILV